MGRTRRLCQKSPRLTWAPTQTVRGGPWGALWVLQTSPNSGLQVPQAPRPRAGPWLRVGTPNVDGGVWHSVQDTPSVGEISGVPSQIGGWWAVMGSWGWGLTLGTTPILFVQLGCYATLAEPPLSAGRSPLPTPAPWGGGLSALARGFTGASGSGLRCSPTPVWTRLWGPRLGRGERALAGRGPNSGHRGPEGSSRRCEGGWLGAQAAASPG